MARKGEIKKLFHQQLFKQEPIEFLLNNFIWQVNHLTQLTQQKTTIHLWTPVIQTDEGMFYLSNDNTYPNALHVITAFPGDSNDSPDESMHIDNDSDIQLDNYGSPMAPAIEDLS